MIEIPPPEKRLCPKHNKPIFPSAWKRGERKQSCAECKREWARKTRPRRKKRWEENFIVCSKHPNRRCNKARYVMDGHKMCASCIDRTSSGVKVRRNRWRLKEYTTNPLYKENVNWYNRSRHRARKIQENKW